MTDKRFNPERANVLMSEKRKQSLPPEKIMEHLDLNPDDSIADLGAGTGYFAIPIAKKTNKVYALDIEPKMLEMLMENAAKEQQNNIQFIESNLDNINLEDNSVDKVIIAFVMHEVPDPDRTLAEIKRILKPGGQMLLLDWEKVESKSGPPLNHRISSDDMVQIFERNGFNKEIIQLNRVSYAVKAIPN